MLFHSPEFMGLLVLTLIVFYGLPRWRLYTLALANAAFYAAAVWRYLVLFFGIALLTYLCSERIGLGRGRTYLWLGIGINLLNLATFKYTVFLLQNLQKLVPPDFDLPALSIILPVGISFYTFQMISYLVDVRKGVVKPSRSFLLLGVHFVLWPAHRPVL